MTSKGTSRYARGGRIQQREIAERAGVSASTVSRVLNNIPGISVAVQDRVRTAAIDLGYLNIVEPSSTIVRTVALFTHLSPHARSIDTFHSDIISGIEAECRRLGINLSLTILEGHNPDTRAVLDHTATQASDGLLFLSVDNETILRRALDLGHRFVVVNSEFPELPVDMFLPDNTLGVLRAIRLLIECGHRRILHYTSLHRRTFHLRLAAYRMALEEAGIPFDPALVIDAPLDPEVGRKTMLELLKGAQSDFTAVFCANDTTTIGIMRGIQEAGLRIPDDISVIGCDDIPMAAFVTPPLTTIRIEREELGVLAVRRLVDRAAFPNLTPIMVKMATQLMVRQSVGPAPELTR